MPLNAANAAKASFDDIYVMPDPRDYYAVLGSLDYSIPTLAKPIFRQLSAAWKRTRGRAATILDLGSSYGINAALFRFPLTFDMLRRRYTRREMMALSPRELRELDRYYFQSWPRAQAERIVVADTSANAIDYAVQVGIADAGVAADLETGVVDDGVARELAGVDIVMSTGCVGYVTEKTFATILNQTSEPPWVVSFCLRMFDYEPVARQLARVGLVTEKLASATFVQRRFRDEAEASDVLGILNQRGVDPTGLESEGLLLAELFVSRPEAEVAAEPLQDLITLTSGRNLNFGPRLMQVRRNGRLALAPVRG
ncbi:MAG: class I SAM-dependent methyltransferase [Hyphomonadaceae bacterium]